jgi:hypothetical protein
MLLAFIGGRCGECNEDLDCPDGGCTSFNPFGVDPPTCNLGEQGGGCEMDAACQPGLQCVQIFELLGFLFFNACSPCSSDLDCPGLDICAPIFELGMWQGSAQCIPPGSLPQDSYCDLDGNGDQACASGLCSVVDIMGLSQVGACGHCNDDSNCGVGPCIQGELILDAGQLTGSTCQP